jgi:hypothetical protein
MNGISSPKLTSKNNYAYTRKKISSQRISNEAQSPKTNHKYPKNSPQRYYNVNQNGDVSNVSGLSNLNNLTTSNFLDGSDTFDNFSEVKPKKEIYMKSKQDERNVILSQKSKHSYLSGERYTGVNDNSSGENGSSLFSDQNKRIVTQKEEEKINYPIGTFSFKHKNSSIPKNAQKSPTFISNVNNFPSETHYNETNNNKRHLKMPSYSNYIANNYYHNDYEININQNENYKMIPHNNNHNVNVNRKRSVPKNYVLTNTKVVSEKVDELTPLPERRRPGQGSSKYYDYDYNQAKSAAILIRRLEYSYNLRICKLYRKYEKQIIFIQRQWRNYVERKDQYLLHKLIEEENRRVIQENAIINFLKRITGVFYRNKVQSAFNILKRKYAKLLREKILNQNANKIIRAYKRYAWRQKKKALRKLKMTIKAFTKRLYWKKILKGAIEYTKNMKDTKFLQIYFKNYLFRTNEEYRLYLAREVHPNIYYYMKYRNEPVIRKQKIQNLIDFIKTWKRFVKFKKDFRIIEFMKIMNLLFYRIYFAKFLTNVLETENALFVYILLNPRIESLLNIYARCAMAGKFRKWKIIYILSLKLKKDNEKQNKFKTKRWIVKKTIINEVVNSS